MDPMFQVLALFCSGAFFGVALAISLVQHPVIVDAGVETGQKLFPGLYFKAAPIQVIFAMLGSVSGLMQWLLGSDIWWLVGTVLLFFVIPYTLLVIKPLNDRLLDDEHVLDDAQAEKLIKRWGSLHAVRTLASGVAFLVFLLQPYI